MNFFLIFFFVISAACGGDDSPITISTPNNADSNSDNQTNNTLENNGMQANNANNDMMPNNEMMPNNQMPNNQMPNNQMDACFQTCNGCCNELGECRPGNDFFECGFAGNLCGICAGECENQECTQPCGPENCDGCCEGTVCLSGVTANACGVFGETCSDCSALDQNCEVATGVCVESDTCADTCSGCCDGETCLPSSEQTCGSSGAACVSCAGAEICTPNGCAVEPLYDILITAATVQQRKDDGTAWDLDFEPEVYVRAFVFDGASSTIEQTTTAAEGYNPSFNQLLRIGKTGQGFSTSFALTIYDEDSASNDDQICRITPAVSASTLQGNSMTTQCATNAATSVTWRLVER